MRLKCLTRTVIAASRLRENLAAFSISSWNTVEIAVNSGVARVAVLGGVGGRHVAGDEVGDEPQRCQCAVSSLGDSVSAELGLGHQLAGDEVEIAVDPCCPCADS
jgi:hypothetical protein